ncbi:hypothetical protein DFQ28_011720 [Apophysomyces sp. BC1034]|nr:hypothetical protein DFQ28_011720 [Apophysomyces sp. BC1034]
MSLDPNNPLEFVEWRSRYSSFWDDGSYLSDEAWSEFPPRRLFGQYTSSVMRSLLEEADNASLIGRRVRSISEVAGCNKFVVHYDCGVSELFDKVILCVGHLPASPLFGADRTRYYPSPYIDNCIPERALVGIIGSRLTAIDAVLALKETGHAGNVVMASRSGKLPKVIDPQRPPYDSGAFLKCLLADPGISVESLIELHRMEIERVAGGSDALRKQALDPITDAVSLRATLDGLGKGNDWQSVLLASYSVVDKLWRTLNDSDKAVFLQQYYGLWMTYLAAFPATSARRLLDEMEQGRLSLSGELVKIEPTDHGFDLIKKDGSKQFVEYLIDGRGVGYGYDELNRDPLFGALLQQGLVDIHPHGGLKVNRTTYEAIGSGGRVTQNFHVIGDLTKGEFLATTDVGRCVAHSVLLADAIVQQRSSGLSSR